MTDKPIIVESELWANSANPSDIIKPDQTKINDGWLYGEKPPHEFFNWFWQFVESTILHIYQNGIPKWDDQTEYNKGALTLEDGTLYRALQYNVNKKPSTHPGKWEEIAFNVNELNDLNDVDINSVNDGDILIYNSVSSNWENKKNYLGEWVEKNFTTSSGNLDYTVSNAVFGQARVFLEGIRLRNDTYTITSTGTDTTISLNEDPGAGRWLLVEYVPEIN